MHEAEGDVRRSMVEVTRIIHLLDVMLPPEQVTTEPLISAVVSGIEGAFHEVYR